ncbi:MAG TPA: penicillin-binding protein 2, partial [Novosphingobium sp.]|nr:penicillin-binding protein 2 [Novosphingobium sp.]
MFGESPHVSSGTLKNSFERRSILIGGLQIGIGTLLAARMGWIGLVQNAKYQMASESNRVNLTLIPPRRGWILDRKGEPLAANRADFRVDLIPARLDDRDHTLKELARLLSLGEDKIADISDKLEKSSGFRPIEVAAGLDWDRFAAISVRLPDLPGVIAQRGYSRWYPNGPSVAHLIGYVGPASAEDYEKSNKNPLLVTPGFKVGKDGLEKSFEMSLRGVPGARRTEVTASGKVVRDLDTREDIPGKPLKLTIDAALQDYASRRIGLESASVVVIDCITGGILALCSMPAFDPNAFAGGIGRLQWKMLNQDDH